MCITNCHIIDRMLMLFYLYYDRHNVQPKASSTPKMNKAKRTKPTKFKPEERLTILNINCRRLSTDSYIPI